MGAWLFRQMKIVKTCARRAFFHFDFTISCSLWFDAQVRSFYSTLTFSVCRIFYFYGFATSPICPFVLVPSQRLLAKWKNLYFNHNFVISFSFLHKLKNWTEARRLKLISGVFFTISHSQASQCASAFTFDHRHDHHHQLNLHTVVVSALSSSSSIEMPTRNATTKRKENQTHSERTTTTKFRFVSVEPFGDGVGCVVFVLFLFIVSFIVYFHNRYQLD